MLDLRVELTGRLDRVRVHVHAKPTGELESAQRSKHIITVGVGDVSQSVVAQILCSAVRIDDHLMLVVIHDGIDREVTPGRC